MASLYLLSRTFGPQNTRFENFENKLIVEQKYVPQRVYLEIMYLLTDKSGLGCSKFKNLIEEPEYFILPCFNKQMVYSVGKI